MNLLALQFVYEDALLSFPGPAPMQPAWDLITDLDQAKSMAWAASDGCLTWWELREKSALSSGTSCRWPDGLVNAVHALSFAFTPWWLEELEEDVFGDLLFCVAYQSERTIEVKLFPMLLDAYKAGGWPCGWSGGYPAGKLCVYWKTTPTDLQPNSAHERRVAYQKRCYRERLVAEWRVRET